MKCTPPVADVGSGKLPALAHVLTNYNYKRRVARFHFRMAKVYRIYTLYGTLPQPTKPMWLLGFTHFTNTYAIHNEEHEHSVVDALDGVESYRYHCSIKSKMMLPFFVFSYMYLSGKTECETAHVLAYSTKNAGKCTYHFLCIVLYFYADENIEYEICLLSFS